MHKSFLVIQSIKEYILTRTSPFPFTKLRCIFCDNEVSHRTAAILTPYFSVCSWIWPLELKMLHKKTVLLYWNGQQDWTPALGLYLWGRDSASSRIRFLPVQAQPTAARSSRRAVIAPRGGARSSHWAIFLFNNIAITNNSTFPKIKLHYSISYCNKTKSNNLI